MPSPCEIITEAGIFTASFTTTRRMSFGEIGLVSDTAVAQRASTLSDHAHGTDTLSYMRASVLADHGHGAEQYAPLVNARVAWVDDAVGSDSFSMRRAVTLTDHGHGTDELTPQRSWVISDAAHGTSIFTPEAIYRVTMKDVAIAADTLRVARASTWSDHAHGADAFKIALAMAMVETAHATETYAIHSHLKSLLTESGVLTDVLSTLVNALEVMSESGCAEDLLVIPSSNTALTAPTDRFGMSRYDNILVNSIVQLGGVLVGVGPAGVYSFDDQSMLDNGMEYTTSVKTGVWDGRIPVMTRPGYMYASMELIDPSSGNYNMELGVTHFMNGAPQRVPVQAEKHTVGGYTVVRFKMPQGIRSRNYQFDLTMQSVKWAFDEMRGVFDLLSRRV